MKGTPSLILRRLYHVHLDAVIEEGPWTLNELRGHPHLKPKCENDIQAARLGEPYVDTSEVQKALAELEYPLYVLDFEAIDGALPPFEGPSAWERVPFQYSLHGVEEGQESVRREEIAHKEFLHIDGGDPRPTLAECLLALTGAPTWALLAAAFTFSLLIWDSLEDHGTPVRSKG